MTDSSKLNFGAYLVIKDQDPDDPAEISFKIQDEDKDHSQGPGHGGKTSFLGKLKQKMFKIKKEDPSTYPLW